MNRTEGAPEKQPLPLSDSVMGGLKRVYFSSVFYTLVTSIEALTPFLLTPILTRYLSPASYGIVTLFVSFTTLARPIVSLSFQDAIKMRFFDFNRVERSHYISTALLLNLVPVIALGAMAIIFRVPLARFMKFPEDWISMIVLTAFLMGIFYLLLTINQFSQDRKQFLLLHVIQSAASFAAITALVLVGLEWQSYVLGKTVGLLLCISVGIWFFTPSLDAPALMRPRMSYVRELLRFGVLYLPAGLSLVASGLINRLIIAHYGGLDQSGFYSIAELFASVYLLGVNGFLHGWMPWLFEHLRVKSRNVRNQVFTVSLLYFIACPLAGFALYGVCLIVAPPLIGQQFHVALPLIPWALAAMTTRAYFVHMMVFLHFKKEPALMSVGSCLFLFSNIVLGILWVQSHGVIGVYVATCVSYVFATIYNSIVVVVLYRRHWSQPEERYIS